MKILGVLGGMGPQASVHFYDLLIRTSIKQYNVKKNADFPHILLDNIPVPDLVKSKEDEERTVAIVEEEARRLKEAGADFLALPCNTMHLYSDRIQRAAGLPFISMIDAVVGRVVADGRKKVGLLGSVTTMQSRLYADPLVQRNVEILFPDEETQEVIGSAIHAVIASDYGEAERYCLENAVDQLASQGAEGVILGCTELPLLAEGTQTHIPLYNSLQILAEACCSELFSVPTIH